MSKDINKFSEQTLLIKQRAEEDAAEAVKQQVIDAERQIALKEQRAERTREECAQKARRAASKRFYESRKHDHQKIGVAINQMLKQFVEEIQGKPLIEADPFDTNMVVKRRQQMSMMKETIELMHKLRDLRKTLAEDTPDLSKEKKTPEDKENVLMFKRLASLDRKKTGTDE